MNKSKTNYIQVTQNLAPLLGELANRIYAKQLDGAFQSPDKIRDWLKYNLLDILYPADLNQAIIKYHEPKIQFTKSGPVGNNSYAISTKRQHYARRKPTKSYRFTSNQIEQQNRIKQAALFWASLDISIKNIWNQTELNPQLTGVYLCKGIYICLLKNQQDIPEPFLPSPHLIDYYLNH